MHRLFMLNNLYVKQLLGLGEIFLNKGLKDIRLDWSSRGQQLKQKKATITIQAKDSKQQVKIALTCETFRLKKTIRLYKLCNMLLCLICNASIKLGNSIKLHFRNQYKLKGNELQVVLSFALSTIYLSNLAIVKLLHNSSMLIEDLLCLKGYSCTSCQHLTVNKKNAIMHQIVKDYMLARGLGQTVVLLQSFS